MGGEVGVVGAEWCGVWGGCGGCRVVWGEVGVVIAEWHRG